MFLNKTKEVKKPSVIDELMMEGDEREVVLRVGRFIAYAPGEEFQEFLRTLIEEINEQNKEDVDLVIDNDEIEVYLFKYLTNFDEIDTSLLELENYKKMKEKPKRAFKKIKNAVHKLAMEELADLAGNLSSFKKLPSDMQKNMISTVKG